MILILMDKEVSASAEDYKFIFNFGEFSMLPSTWSKEMGAGVKG